MRKVNAADDVLAERQFLHMRVSLQKNFFKYNKLSNIIINKLLIIINNSNKQLFNTTVGFFKAVGKRKLRG